MSEIVSYRNVTATAAIVGFNAALAIGASSWPAPEPLYSTIQSNSTYSFFEKSLQVSPATTSPDFANDIAGVFAALSEGQQPLGADFEAVWDANVDALYQS
jgi:hypothetical protein